MLSHVVHVSRETHTRHVVVAPFAYRVGDATMADPLVMRVKGYALDTQMSMVKVPMSEQQLSANCFNRYRRIEMTGWII